MCISNPITDVPSFQSNIAFDDDKRAIPICLIRDATRRQSTALNCYFIQLRDYQRDKARKSFGPSEENILARTWYETVYSKSKVPHTCDIFEKRAVRALNWHEKTSKKRFTNLQVRRRLQHMLRLHRVVLNKSLQGYEKWSGESHITFHPEFSSFHALYGYIECEKISPRTNKKSFGRRRWDQAAKCEHITMELECPHRRLAPAHYITKVEPPDATNFPQSQTCRRFTTTDDIIIVESWFKCNSSSHGQEGLALEKRIAKVLNAHVREQNRETENFFNGMQVHLRLIQLLQTYNSVLKEWDNVKKDESIVLKYQEFMDFGGVFRVLGGRRVIMQHNTSEASRAGCFSKYVVSIPQRINKTEPSQNAQASSVVASLQDDEQFEAEKINWERMVSTQTPELGSNVHTNPLARTKGMKRPREQQPTVTDSMHSHIQKIQSARDVQSLQTNEGAMRKHPRLNGQDVVRGPNGAKERPKSEIMNSSSSWEQKLRILEAEVRSEELEVKKEELALKRAELRAQRAKVEQGTHFQHEMEVLKYLKELTVGLAEVAPRAETNKIVNMIMRVLAQMER